MTSRKARSSLLVHTLMVRLLRLVVGASARLATLRTTVPLRSASESAPWMVMWTLRTDWADKPPPSPRVILSGARAVAVVDALDQVREDSLSALVASIPLDNERSRSNGRTPG